MCVVRARSYILCRAISLLRELFGALPWSSSQWSGAAQVPEELGAVPPRRGRGAEAPGPGHAAAAVLASSADRSEVHDYVQRRGKPSIPQMRSHTELVCTRLQMSHGSSVLGDLSTLCSGLGKWWRSQFIIQHSAYGDVPCTRLCAIRPTPRTPCGRSDGKQAVLLLMDRRDDPLTPLLNQWTYQVPRRKPGRQEGSRRNHARQLRRTA